MMSGQQTRGLIVTLAVALVAGLVYAFLMFGSGCNPHATAWKTTAAVKSAGNLADSTLATQAEKRHHYCLAKYGTKTPEYQHCIQEYYAALLAWKNFARPAINSALRATIEGLTIADKVKLKPDFDWKSALKPAACAILGIVSEWKHLFGKHAETIVGVLKGAGSFVCED